MQHILVLGAGKSATVLIDYLLDNAAEYQWTVTIGDLDEDLAKQKIKAHPQGNAVYFNADDAALCQKLIGESDIVVSLLPAFVHPVVAKICVALGKHFVSASYVSDAMRALHNEAVSKGLILMNEMGLDPGIDHMSAMKIIDHVRNMGAEITGFRSYTGGLVAPESDNNPWNYKFTWNPRNVVLAGQGTAKFLSNHRDKYIPYHRLFASYDIMDVPGYGKFEGYANRDSLSYRSVYGLEHTGTIIRGTLRKQGFCDAWNVFVQLGMTDDTYHLEDAHKHNWSDFTDAFIPSGAGSVRERLQQYLAIDNEQIMHKLDWLGLFDNNPIFTQIPERTFTPAQLLQMLLESKLSLDAGDKDMCVMLHVMDYSLHGKAYSLQSSMVAIGQDEVYTAMAKTVGLPAAIAVKHILSGTWQHTGVVTPVHSDIYTPVLQELSDTFNIHFVETLQEFA